MKHTAFFLAFLLLVPLSASVSAAPPESAHAQPQPSVDGHTPNPQAALSRLDADGDGRISRDEFAAGHAVRAAKQAGHASAGGAHPAPDFAAIDTDGDGYLVVAELLAFHGRMSPPPQAAAGGRLAQKFAQADRDGDGRLARAEVEQALPPLAQRFAALDADGDGFLSQAELEAGHGRH